jgi:hypothetical protein
MWPVSIFYLTTLKCNIILTLKSTSELQLLHFIRGQSKAMSWTTPFGWQTPLFILKVSLGRLVFQRKRLFVKLRSLFLLALIVSAVGSYFARVFLPFKPGLKRFFCFSAHLCLCMRINKCVRSLLEGEKED